MDMQASDPLVLLVPSEETSFSGRGLKSRGSGKEEIKPGDGPARFSGVLIHLPRRPLIKNITVTIRTERPNRPVCVGNLNPIFLCFVRSFVNNIGGPIGGFKMFTDSLNRFFRNDCEKVTYNSAQ